MKFIVEIKDYESGMEDDIHASDVEEAIMDKMDERGDGGTCEVKVPS